MDQASRAARSVRARTVRRGRQHVDAARCVPSARRIRALAAASESRNVPGAVSVARGSRRFRLAHRSQLRVRESGLSRLARQHHIQGSGPAELLLFSDVGPDDAPTRIRVGSHLDIARRLAPAGERGLSLRELAANDFSESAGRPESWRRERREPSICVIHFSCAQPAHHSARPRFMAQPPLLPAGPLRLDGTAGHSSPVERAIMLALEENGSAGLKS